MFTDLYNIEELGSSWMLVGLCLYLSFQTSTNTEVAITQDICFIRNQAWVN